MRPNPQDKPPTFLRHPALVFLHITVLMMDSFDQVEDVVKYKVMDSFVQNEMTFTVDLFLALHWRDHRWGLQKGKDDLTFWPNI